MEPLAVPDRVRAFVQRNVPRAREAARTLLEQRGEMRMSPDGKWLPFTAEQWIAHRETAFVWHARVKMAPLVTAVVEDAYERGRGRLDAKVWGIVPVAHARGVDIDRGEIQRYLGELAWAPRALIENPSLRFGEGTDGPVRIACGDAATYVDLRFDDEGDVAGIYSRTRVYRDRATPWGGDFFDYRDFSGLRLPTRAEVFWDLPSGRFVYWRGEIHAASWAP